MSSLRADRTAAAKTEENLHIRGRELVTFEEVQRRADAVREWWDHGVFWGGIKLPSEAAPTHFCAVGAPGSGKTILLRLLMQSVLPLVGAKRKTIPVEEESESGAIKEALSPKKYLNLPDYLKLSREQRKDYVSIIKYLYHKMPRLRVKTGFQGVLQATVLCIVIAYFLLLVGIIAITYWGISVLLLLLLVDASLFFVKSVKQQPVKQQPEPRSRHPSEWDGHRAIIFDAKQDILPQLYGMGLSCRIATLNPFDARCAAWDMAKDVVAPATAQQIAAILIPQEKNASQPFFSDAARHLLTGVLIALIKSTRQTWTFRDVIFAMKSRARLEQLLSNVPETRDLVDLYLKEERVSQNIMATIATKIAPYEFVAACWAKAKENVSLHDWLQGEYIVVLGNDEANRDAIGAINRVLFKRLTELILAQKETTTGRTWIFLDEVREAGELEGLGRLMTTGRSKGACVVLGFQDIEGLRDAYGEKAANEIIGMCANKALLRMESPETAAWAASLLGKYDTYEDKYSHTAGTNEGWSRGDSSSRDGFSNSTGYSGGFNSAETVNRERVERETVLASEFMSLPPTNPRNGLTGYILTRSVGAYKMTLSGDQITRLLQPLAKDVPTILHRSSEDQYLEHWTEKDLSRLGISLSESRPAPPGSAGTQKQTIIGYLDGLEGPYRGEVFPLISPSIMVGGDPGNDISLPKDPRISGNHAQILLDGETLFLCDKSSAHGVFVNGERIVRAPLAEEDVVRFGSCSFRLRLALPSKPDPPRSPKREVPAGAKPEVRRRLVGLKGPYAGQVLEINRAVTSVGQEAGRDIALVEDGSVSGEHAYLVEENDLVVIYDRGSANGTFVNEKRILRQPLSSGDSVKFGSSTFRFEAPTVQRTGPSRLKDIERF